MQTQNKRHINLVNINIDMTWASFDKAPKGSQIYVVGKPNYPYLKVIHLLSKSDLELELIDTYIWRFIVHY